MSAAAGVVAALSAGLAGACARQEAPPGGPEDLRPPVVVRTVPEAFAVVEDLDEVRFEFDERISERVTGGTLADAVTISPRSGEVRVSKGRRHLSVRPAGGFQPDRVYRVTLRPMVSDLFGNRLGDPFELVFSTGRDPVPTTVAGEVWDRITGRAVSNATVYATTPDGLVHEASTDAQGIFALRYVPEGTIAVTAFDDVNRNREVDSTEVQGGTSVTLAPGDTALVDFFVLEPDTAAANLMSAEPLDSVTVTLTFDDFLDPESDVEGLTIAVRGDGPAPGVVGRWHESDYAVFVESVADSLARLDSIRAAEAGPPVPTESADSTASAAEPGADDPEAAPAPVDSLAAPAPADTVVVGVPALPAARGPTPLQPLQGERPGPDDAGRVLPSRRVVLLLDGSLPFDVPFEVEVQGAVNINGLPGGGGTTELVRETPPPDTTAADSAAADSSAVLAPPDTGSAAFRPRPRVPR